jgi:hypothetical protein
VRLWLVVVHLGTPNCRTSVASSAWPARIALDVGVAGEHGRVRSNLLSDDHSVCGNAGKHRIVLEAYGTPLDRVGRLEYLLRWTERDGAGLSSSGPRGSW